MKECNDVNEYITGWMSELPKFVLLWSYEWMIYAKVWPRHSDFFYFLLCYWMNEPKKLMNEWMKS